MTVPKYLSRNTEPDILLRIIAAERSRGLFRDNRARSDPDLRLAAAKLVERIGKAIRDEAEQLGRTIGKTSALEIDELADLLLWLTIEYLQQMPIARDSDFYRKLPKAHQLTLRHAAPTFGLQKIFDHALNDWTWAVPFEEQNKL